MTAVHRRYHALLEVSNVLNSQREMDSLWRACTECINVVAWERAGVLLYVPEEDGSDFTLLKPTCRGGCSNVARSVHETVAP